MNHIEENFEKIFEADVAGRIIQIQQGHATMQQIFDMWKIEILRGAHGGNLKATDMTRNVVMFYLESKACIGHRMLSPTQQATMFSTGVHTEIELFIEFQSDEDGTQFARIFNVTFLRNLTGPPERMQPQMIPGHGPVHSHDGGQFQQVYQDPLRYKAVEIQIIDPPDSHSVQSSPKVPPSPGLKDPVPTAVNEIDLLFEARQSNSSEQASSLEIMLDMLAEAIEAGNIEQTKEIAADLARRKVKITMQPIYDAQDTSLESIELDKTIKLVVRVEDRDYSGGQFTLNVNPATTTIGMLKQKTFQKVHFPPQVQRWVIGRRLPKENETLERCGVRSSGTIVYLYLISAVEANIRKKNDEPPFLIESVPQKTEDGIQGNPSTTASASTPKAAQPTSEVVNSLHKKLQTEGSASSGESTSSGPGIQESLEQRGSQAIVGKPPSTQKLPIQEQTRLNLSGWTCPACTLLNVPTRPGCEACGERRPDEYQIPTDCYVPPEEKRRMEVEMVLDVLAHDAEIKRKVEQRKDALANYDRMVQTAQQRVIPNRDPFDCDICYNLVSAGDGVMLRECLHSFCRDCLKMTILTSVDPCVTCPYRGEEYACDAVITGQEIQSLLDQEEFSQYLSRSLALAERKEQNSYHCKTTNCVGWCIYEDEVNWFNCEVCGRRNCLTCQAIHEKQNCKEYQEDLKSKAANDVAARKTQEMLERLIAKGDAMKCPQCAVILQKKDGCDWMRCSMCRTEICWATKGLRWGPKGNGDTTGGCKCRLNGKRCAPNCRNCH